MTTDSNQSIKIKGGKPLKGEITIRGAKNSIPKNMVAALLTDEPCQLSNISNIEDVRIVSEMVEALGGEVKFSDNKESLKISTQNLHEIQKENVDKFIGKSRIPVLFCGPLLHRLGKAVIPQLGGCNIGPRPINFHLDALKKMGAQVREEGCNLHLSAKKLTGCKINLGYPSVGATEQVLLTAVLAEGVTELSNAAIEPEILDLICLLQKMGAIISVDTDRVITINGVKKLHGFEHTAIPDRLEAASWACAAAATGGKIFIKNAQQIDMLTFLNKFRQIGGGFEISDEGITFWRENGHLLPIAIETDVHPGFMTDWQQPFTITLTQAHGVSIIHETVYEERFGYVNALNQMGAQIQLYKDCLGGKVCRFGQKNHLHSAVIAGATPLKGARVTIPDLRAGFSYVIAALVAEGESTIENIGIIKRGYENFMEKLVAVGADIEN